MPSMKPAIYPFRASDYQFKRERTDRIPLEKTDPPSPWSYEIARAAGIIIFLAASWFLLLILAGTQ